MRTIPFLLGLLATAAPVAAAPVTSSALLVPSGPSVADASMGPVFISECPVGDRLVGIRVLRATGVSGIVAICTPLDLMPSGTAWAAPPKPVKGPAPPPPPVMVTRSVAHQLHGRIVRASLDGGYEERTMVFGELVLEETIPDPGQPVGPPVIQFSHKTTDDVMCPEGSFVKGIRYETPKAGGVAAVELHCARDEKPVAIVAMARVRKRSKKAEPAPRDVAHLQRIDCKGTASNPDDGEAVDALFGTVDEAGRVQSLGLSCGPTIDPAAVTHRFGKQMTKFSRQLPGLFGL